MLTCWLPTTSILVVIERIYRYQFKSICLRNHKLFPILFIRFWIYIKFSMLWKKNETHGSSIWEVIDWKVCLFKWIIGYVFEKSLAMNVLKSPKNSWNLQKSTFILLFHHFQENWVSKKLFLIRSDILGQLDNKYTGNYVYSRKLGRVYRYQFKSVYLRNAKPFAIFFEFFFMYIKFKMWWKKMSLIGQFFLKVLTPKMRWFKSIRGLVSESVWQWPC